MLDLVIGSDRTGRQLFLRDVATLERGDQDPPRRLLRYDGKPAIGLGISTVQGGNVVTMGEGVRRKLEELKRNQPIGIEIGEINFQPEAVTAATNDFMFNLAKAVTIVFVVLLFAMGRKTGLIIGMVLFLTIMATFLVMYMKGDLLMERISLGALIIALCMLTDNAIIVIEGIKVGIEAGEDKLEVVREVVAQNQWPLFGATAIGIIAFAAIGLSEDQHRRILQLAVLGHPDFPEPELGVVDHRHAALELPVFQADRRWAASGSSDPYGGLFFRVYRNLLVLALRFRWAVVAAVGRAVRRGAVRLHEGRPELFPARDPAAIHGGCLSAGRHPHPRNGGVRQRPSSSTSRISPASPTSRRSSAAAACASCSSTLRKRRTAPSCSSWSMSMTGARSTG